MRPRPDRTCAEGPHAGDYLASLRGDYDAVVMGLLLDAGLVDRIVLKVNPFVMGTGMPLFAGARKAVAMGPPEVHAYSNGDTADQLPSRERVMSIDQQAVGLPRAMGYGIVLRQTQRPIAERSVLTGE